MKKYNEDFVVNQTGDASNSETSRYSGEFNEPDPKDAAIDASTREIIEILYRGKPGSTDPTETLIKRAIRELIRKTSS